MTVSQTSLLAWKEIQNKIGNRRQQVYDALKELGEANNFQLAEKTGLPINSVTPRVNELSKMNPPLVVISCMRPGPPIGKITKFWRCA